MEQGKTKTESREDRIRNGEMKVIGADFLRKLWIGSGNILKSNMTYAKEHYGLPTHNEHIKPYSCGVVVFDDNGEMIFRSSNNVIKEKRVNGASATKPILAFYYLKYLSDKKILDLNDIDKPQIELADGSKLPIKELLRRVLGVSTNNELRDLRIMFAKAYESEIANPMNIIESKINREIGAEHDEDKYILRFSDTGKEKEALGNTAKIETLTKMFMHVVNECRDENSELPKVFRDAFVDSMKYLPDIKENYLVHTLKRQFEVMKENNRDKKYEDLEIIEKSGWFADQGDDMNTVNSLIRFKYKGRYYTIGWYIETPEVLKDHYVKEHVVKEEDRIEQQTRFKDLGGEVLADILHTHLASLQV